MMPFHSSTDRTAFRTDGDLIRYGYRFGLPDHKAYPDIAFSALGSILSIFRHYLGATWRPVSIYCNMPPVTVSYDVELVFGCPVSWRGRRLEICFNRGELAARPSRPLPRCTTLEEVKRERDSDLPRTISDCVAHTIQIRIVSGATASLDATSRAIGLGPRSLQRLLREEGLTFRDLSSRVRIDRAKELLRHGGLMVGEIATDLGYENPNNFARAFKRMTGISPKCFRDLNHTRS